MNDARRKELNKVISMIEEAKSILESVRDEEQEAYDNMPESLQSGEKGEKVSEAIDAMTTAADEFDSVTSNIETAME